MSVPIIAWPVITLVTTGVFVVHVPHGGTVRVLSVVLIVVADSFPLVVFDFSLIR
jgi:hypothetical protein